MSTTEDPILDAHVNETANKALSTDDENVNKWKAAVEGGCTFFPSAASADTVRATQKDDKHAKANFIAFDPENFPLIVVDKEDDDTDEVEVPPQMEIKEMSLEEFVNPPVVSRLTVDDLKRDPVFKHLFGYKRGTAEEVFGQFTDEELFKENRQIIPALIIANELTDDDVIEIFTYLTDKRNMSLKCRAPRWTQSSKDEEWSLWNELHGRSHQYPRAGGLSLLVFHAHMQRKENIPEEDEALAIAAGNKLQFLVDYILTHQKSTVDLSFAAWLALNVTSSVKIRKQLLEHYIETHDLIDYDYEEAELFQSFVVKLHEAPNTEARKALLEDHIAKMREAKREWKQRQTIALKQIRENSPPELNDQEIYNLLPNDLLFFKYYD